MYVFLLLVAAAVFGSAAEPLIVVDESGAPVAGAHVVFSNPRGATDVETTDPTGRVAARAGFEPATADISRPGYAALHVALGRAVRRVVLARSLPVIGNVSVVTGSARSLHELPQSASLLDKAAIGLAPSATTDRLLRELPGNDRTRSNSAFTNYGQLRASFSGAGNDRGAVLVDGIPAQDGFGGQIDWQAYPGDELERAELLRGAGSALYGSGAVGGALSLTTFGPRVGRDAPAGADGRVELGAGTNRSADDALQARVPLGPDFGASVAGNVARLAYRDLPPAYGSPIDGSAVGQSGATHEKVRFSDGATTVDLAGLFASDHQDEGRQNYTFDRFLSQESASATQRVGSALAGLTLYDRDTRVYNIADLFPTKPGALRYVQRVPTNENGLFASLRDSVGPADLALYIDRRRVDGRSEQDGPTGALQALGTGTQLSQGIALQATFRTSRFEALVGARADRVRYDDLALETVKAGAPASVQNVAGHDEGAISPRAALRYDLTPRLAVRVSSGGGFRAPYLNELVRGYNVGATVMAPNPYLVPERSRTDGAGLDYALGSSGRLALDVLETRVNDAIAFVTLSPTLMKRENFDRTQTDGETLTYAQLLNACTRLRLSGTTQYARVTDGPPGTIGKALAYIPDRSATLGVDAASRGPLAFSVDGTYAGQTYADDRQAQPLGAALLFGATIRATTGAGTTISLTGDNLTHQTYLSSIDRYGPPLTVTLHVAVPIGASVAHDSACRL